MTVDASATWWRVSLEFGPDFIRESEILSLLLLSISSLSRRSLSVFQLCSHAHNSHLAAEDEDLKSVIFSTPLRIAASKASAENQQIDFHQIKSCWKTSSVQVEAKSSSESQQWTFSVFLFIHQTFCVCLWCGAKKNSRLTIWINLGYSRASRQRSKRILGEFECPSRRFSFKLPARKVGEKNWKFLRKKRKCWWLVGGEIHNF